MGGLSLKVGVGVGGGGRGWGSGVGDAGRLRRCTVGVCVRRFSLSLSPPPLAGASTRRPPSKSRARAVRNQFLTYGGNGVRHMGKRGKKHPSTNSDLSPIARTFGASSGGVSYRLRHEPLPELKSARISPPSPRRASRERDPWPTPALVDGGVGGRPTCLLAHAKLNQLEIPIRDPNERPQLEIPIRDPN